MIPIRETEKFRQGRIGEIIQRALYQQWGVNFIDIAGSTNGRAPLLHSAQMQLPAADNLAIKTAPCWLENKTKTHHNPWNGGSLSDEIKTSPRIEEGIDTSKWLTYQAVEQRTKMPFVLSILSLDESEMLAATLQQLGEPRWSPDPDYDMVNWDVRSFARVARLDPERLHRYFENRRIGDEWLVEPPNDRKLADIADFLKPADSEFDVVLQHVFDQVEHSWNDPAFKSIGAANLPYMAWLRRRYGL